MTTHIWLCNSCQNKLAFLLCQVKENLFQEVVGHTTERQTNFQHKQYIFANLHTTQQNLSH